MSRWHLLLIVAEGLLAALVILTAWPGGFELYAWLVWGAYVVLYAYFASYLMGYWLANGQMAVAAHGVVVIATFLTFGWGPALAVLLMGAPLAEGARLFLHRYLGGQRRWSWRQALRNIAADGGAVGLAIAVGGLAYTALGGLLPLTSLRPRDLVPTFALCAAHFAVYSLVLLGLNEGWPLTRRHLKAYMPPTRLVAELVLAVPSVAVLAFAFHAFDRLGMVLLLCVIAAGVLLFHALSRSHRVLERRLEQLAALSAVGQLTNTLSLPGLFEAIYNHVSKVLDAPIFYVALYDEAQGTLDFPLVVVHGERVRWPSRPLENGLAEYVLRHGRALRIGQGVVGPDPTPDTFVELPGVSCQSYLGVPMRNGGHVLGVIAVQHPARANAYAATDQSLLETVAAQTAVSLDNMHLLAQAQSRADELLLINNVSSMVNASLDLELIIKTISQVALELSKAQKAAIFLKRERLPQMRLAYSIHCGADFVEALRHFPLTADHPWGEFLQKGQLVAVADLEQDERLAGLRAMAAREGFRALTAVPLFFRQDLIGFLSVYYEAPHEPDNGELSLLGILANQTAVAIENARLFEDTQATVARLGYLAESTRAFTGSLALDTVAGTVVDWMVEGLQLDVATVAMWNRDQDLLVTQAAARSEPVPPGASVLDLSCALDGFPEAVGVLRGQWTRVLDSSEREASPLLKDLFAGARLHTLALVPLIVHEQAIGLLTLGLGGGQSFSPRDVNLAEAVANQAAVAIQNARLYSLTEEALTARLMELSALERVLRRISASVDLEAIIEEVLNAAFTATNADLVCCGLATGSDGMMLFFRAGDSLDVVRQYPFDPDRGVSGRVMRTGQPALIADTAQAPDYLALGDLPPMRSELCVPILHEGEPPLGVFNLESVEEDAFTEYHLRFLQHLAGHTAIAVERARLFESRQHQIEVLGRLRALSLDLLNAPSVEAVLEAVCSGAMRLVDAHNVHLYTYDGTSNGLTFAASLWADGRWNVEAVTPRLDGSTYRAARAGEPTINGDIQRLPGVPTRAIANVPLKDAGGQVVGVLNAAIVNPRAFGEAELRTLELLANQAAVALQSAALYEEVRRGRDRIQTVLNTVRDGLVLVDSGGVLLEANPAVERLFGVDIRPYRGQHVLFAVRALARQGRRFPPYTAAQIKEVARALRDAPRQPIQRQYEVEVGGQKLFIEEESVPVLDEAGNPLGYLFVFYDATEGRKLELYRAELTHMMIHDLRSPLTAIIGSLELVESLRHDPGEVEVLDEVLQIARNTADDLLNMVESLLDIARLETGELPLNLERIPLAQPLQEALNALDVLARSMEISIITRLPTGLPLLTIDCDKIRRVFVNLLDNALQFTPLGGQVIVEVQARAAEGQVVVSVTDQGPGIPADVRERIFEQFVTGVTPAPPGRQRRGMGLGLAFCRLAIEAHRGRIWIEDAPGGGATFRFVLPVTPEMSMMQEEVPQE